MKITPEQMDDMDSRPLIEQADESRLSPRLLKVMRARSGAKPAVAGSQEEAASRKASGDTAVLKRKAS